MPTTDAADFLRRSLATLEAADYDAWHATERLVLADALEDLGDGRSAWLRGLKDVEPVYEIPLGVAGSELWVERASVTALRSEGGGLADKDNVTFRYTVYPDLSECWTMVVKCQDFGRTVVSVRLDIPGQSPVVITETLDRDRAIGERRRAILSTLTSPKP